MNVGRQATEWIGGQAAGWLVKDDAEDQVDPSAEARARREAEKAKRQEAARAALVGAMGGQNEWATALEAGLDAADQAALTGAQKQLDAAQSDAVKISAALDVAKEQLQTLREKAVGDLSNASLADLTRIAKEGRRAEANEEAAIAVVVELQRRKGVAAEQAAHWRSECGRLRTVSLNRLANAMAMELLAMAQNMAAGLAELRRVEVLIGSLGGESFCRIGGHTLAPLLFHQVVQAQVDRQSQWPESADRG